MAPKNAGLAKKMGYKNVKAMSKGVPGWKKIKKHVVASDKFVKTGNIILVDVRSSADYKKGHVARAISAPLADFAEIVEDDFPDKKLAPVVVYGNSLADAKKAYGIVKKAGYKKSSVMGTSFKDWKGNLTTTPSPEDIEWVRILGKGEVSVADFKKATDGGDPNVFVIDARTEDEVAELGIFKNTVNISLDEIPNRMNDIPKNKMIYVHCSTGARADMVYQELKKNGYKVKFLLLDISDASCDCEILKP